MGGVEGDIGAAKKVVRPTRRLAPQSKLLPGHEATSCDNVGAEGRTVVLSSGRRTPRTKATMITRRLPRAGCCRERLLPPSIA